ncbi:MAG: PAN domain-containing protein, partial [Pseudomonadota bacterium]|nr:PAN domain-containing protein [Pseudomonadota bacterium]
AAVAAFAAPSAEAAQFKLVMMEDGSHRCELSGEIVSGDDLRFRDLSPYDCTLSLDSPGGNFATALRIIEEMGSFTPTVVESGNRCLSACALVFMAGMYNEDGAYAFRVMQAGAKVGFHRPYLDLGGEDDAVFSAREIERAFSGSIDVINDLIKRSNRRFYTGNSSAESYFFPPRLLTSMLEKGRDAFHELETVGDLLIAGVFFNALNDGGLASVSPDIATLRTVCENFYWQEVQNFELYGEKKGKFDPLEFYDSEYAQYSGNPAQGEETIRGETYTVFHDYPAPEGTYRDCLVAARDGEYTAAFRYENDNYAFTRLRPVFAFPRHMKIEAIGARRADLTGPAATPDPTNVSFSQLENVDLSGSERSRVKGIDLGACIAACRDDDACAGYTYDKWNGWCFLKGSVARQLVSPKAVSGVRSGIATPAPWRGPVEMRRYGRKYFPGNGYATTRLASADACERQCSGQSQCIAFTFYHAGTRCRLYSSVGEYFGHDGADSGAKLQTE